jgi:signal transduction histidine kinase
LTHYKNYLAELIQMDNTKKSDELILAYQELALQHKERDKRASELIIANVERNLEVVEKAKRAAELVLANIELDFQNNEREKRAAELVIANLERAFQNEEKEKRAAELTVANKELLIQNTEKENRAAELIVANKELAFQNEEKEKRAAELFIANKELVFQNKEKENRAAELDIANKELLFQNTEKEKRAAELIVANKELAFQNEEKEKRAAELLVVNKELIFQNREKEKRAAELVIANRELALQNQEIELNKRKDEFIGIASHELKTPLTSISAYLQFLKRSLVGESKKEIVDKALRQVGKLSGLISDLLDVSKIEAGKLTLHFSTFDICELTKEVIEIIEFNAQGHKIEYSCVDHSLIVSADRQRIEQVMINLLSNGIKYSPQGDRLLISLSQTDADIVFSVKDFGLGIKEDEQLHVFSRFYRAEGLAPHISGLGIGLYISDDIITRHKGILGVESKLGIGSTFSFKIPKAAKALNLPE